MTAGNKVDLLVKDDGSTEVLLVSPEPKRSAQKIPRKLKICFGILQCVFVVCLVAFLVFFFLHREIVRSSEYKVHGMIEGEKFVGKLNFDPLHHTESFTCGTTQSISDGLNEMTAVIVSAPSGERICLIRDDRSYGLSSPPIFPPPEMLDSMMNGTEDEDMQVVMDDIIWGQDEKSPVDLGELPESLSARCRGIPAFKMVPWSLDFVPDENEQIDEDQGISHDYIDLQYDVTQDDYLFRKERAAPNNGNRAREERERQVRREEERRMRPSESRAGQSERRAEQSDSDHGMRCCQLCRRTYLQCNRVSVPTRSSRYPYYQQTTQCVVVLPCSYYRAMGVGL